MLREFLSQGRQRGSSGREEKNEIFHEWVFSEERVYQGREGLGVCGKHEAPCNCLLLGLRKEASKKQIL